MEGSDSIVESPRELQDRLEAERAGLPFLIHRDAHGSRRISPLDPESRTIIGRGPDVDIDLAFDTEVSRSHAEIHPVGSEWTLVDEGLSRNGTFVNNERVVSRRRLRDGDVIRVGRGELRFRDPAPEPDAEQAGETEPASDDATPPPITERQHEVLVALCSPFSDGSELAVPATDREIAEHVGLSVDAVAAHLGELFERFGLSGLAADEKRVRLCELALRSGTVTLRDIGVGPNRALDH